MVTVDWAEEHARLLRAVDERDKAIVRLGRKNERLREALRAYGNHTYRCSTKLWAKCDCGWDKARAALEEAGDE